MKPLGKQPGHLTACPDLCQALSQGGKLTQCVIMEPRPCQALLGLDLAAFPGLEERTHHRARTSSPMLGSQKEQRGCSCPRPSSSGNPSPGLIGGALTISSKHSSACGTAKA